MTETISEERVAEALSMIDAQLVALGPREIIAASEVADLLLDLRLLLAESPDAEPVAV